MRGSGETGTARWTAVLIASLVVLAGSVVGPWGSAPVAAAPSAAGVGVAVPYAVEPVGRVGRPGGPGSPERAGRTRQPVIVTTLGPTGALVTGAEQVVLGVHGRGPTAIYDDPYAARPIGTTSAALLPQEGVAVFFVEHEAPGSVDYEAGLVGGTARASTVGQVAPSVAPIERVATLGLSAGPRPNGRVEVEVSPRDLQGVAVEGEIPVELYASGPGALALPGAAPGTLPGAGTPARRLVAVARNGRLVVDLGPVTGELTLVARVAPPRPRPALAWPATGLRVPVRAFSSRAPAGGSRSRPATALSWNVHHGAPQDSAFDPDAGLGVLRAVLADVAALQEVDDDRSRSGGTDLSARWAESLGQNAVYGPNLFAPAQVPGDQPAWYGNAVLTSLPVVGASNLALPQLLLPGRSTEARGLLSVTVRTDRGDRTSFDTHLDLNQGERILQGRSIRRQLDVAGKGLAFLGGDLNTTPGRVDFDLLAAPPGVYDAWAAVGTGPGYTFSARSPSVRIDVIFPSRRITALAAEVVATTASDHRPLRVVLDLPT